MIAHWPKRIKKNIGGVTAEYGHVMDIMATCVDLADADYPSVYKGHDIIPMEGISLAPIFREGRGMAMNTMASNISTKEHSSQMTDVRS